MTRKEGRKEGFQIWGDRSVLTQTAETSRCSFQREKRTSRTPPTMMTVSSFQIQFPYSFQFPDTVSRYGSIVSVSSFHAQ